MDPLEARLKHLELIQGAIARMAQNSFVIKGWSITLVSALLAFGEGKTDPRYAFLPLAAALVFWSLDAYYLQLERCFRSLYETSAATKDAPTFSLSIDAHPASYREAFLRPAVMLPHLLVVLLAISIPVFVSRPW